MGAKKVNQGVIRTKKALKEALIALLNEKALREITITEVVTRAGYTRGTFYKHYQYKEDLLDEILQETVDGFKQAFEEPYERRRDLHDMRRLSDSSLRIFQYISEHSAAFSLFLKEKALGFQEKLGETLQEVFRHDYELLFPKIPSHINREILINQNVFALMGVITYWVQTGYRCSDKYMTEQVLEIARLTYRPDIPSCLG